MKHLGFTGHRIEGPEFLMRMVDFAPAPPPHHQTSVLLAKLRLYHKL
jgi:hypothetical protein